MPVPVKKSALRDGSCPEKSTDRKSSKLKVLRSATTALRKTKVEKKSFLNKKKEVCSKKHKIISCKHCGNLLKPSNSPKKVCKCRKSIVTVKGISKKSKVNLKVIKNYDSKLYGFPVVTISLEDRMKADAATMKLRKGQRIGEISSSSKNRLAKNESEDDTEDSLSLYTQSDDSENEDDDFQPNKANSKKKPKIKENKSKPKPKSSLNSYKFEPKPDYEDEQSSTSIESLPDIPFPTSGSLTKVEATPIYHTTTNGSGSSETKQNQTKLQVKQKSSKVSPKNMGSIQAKTPKKSNDDKVKSKTTGTVRSLRSTDSHNNLVGETLSSKLHGKPIRTTDRHQNIFGNEPSSSKLNTKVARPNESYNNFGNEPSTSGLKSPTKVVRNNESSKNSATEPSISKSKVVRSTDRHSNVSNEPSSSKLNTKGFRTNDSCNNFSDEPSTSKSNTKGVRTTDRHSNFSNDPSISKFNTKVVRRSSTSSPQRTVKSRNSSSSSYKSPSHDSLGNDGVKSGSSSHTNESEKSYSLRCLEKKATVVAGSPASDSRSETYELRTPIRSSIKMIPPRPITPRGRGRPRKTPISETNHTVVPGTESSTPLTRSQRRATQVSDGDPLSKTPKLSDETRINDLSSEDTSEETAFEPKPSTISLKTDLSSSASKQSRDAIALRARQSKIMAKSRVLQSNRSHSAAMKVFREMRKEEEQKQRLRHHEPQKPDSYNLPSSSEHYQSGVNSSTFSAVASSSNFPTSTTGLLNNGYVDPVNSATVLTTSTSLGLVKKAYPKARCDLCNMTFTRRFSLTKHLQTIQHQKMVQRMNAASSQGLQMSASEVPKLTRERRSHTPAPGSSLRDLQRRDNDDVHFASGSRPREKMSMVEESVHELESGFSDANQLESSEEDFEEESSQPEIEEWKSGKTLGRNDFICEICQEKFTEKFAFGEHLWNHREDASLTCSVCNVRFEDSDNYNQHIDSAHLENTKFSCQYCPSKFNREDYLKKHIRSHKRNEKQRYVCSVCDKRFSGKTLLMHHFDAKHFSLGRQRVELACDDDSDEFSKHPSTPKVTFTYNDCYSDDDDLPLYDNYGRCSDQEEFMNQMPSIDLEETDRRPVSSDGPHDCVSSNDPIPMITPEDYGRELPMENVSRNNSGPINRGATPRSEQVGTSSMSPAFRSETDIRVGCGNKKERPPCDEDENPLQCLDCRKVFETRKYLLKHVEYFSNPDQKLKFTFDLKSPVQKQTSIVHKSLLKKSQNIGSIGTRKSPQSPKHRKVGSRTIPKLLPILPNNKEKNPQDPLTSEKPSPSTSTRVNKTTRPPSSLPALPKTGLASQQPQTLQVATSSITNDPTRRLGLLPHVTNSPSKAEACRPLHTCELCSKAFTEIQTLSIHMWFHQNENLFSCPDCEAKCERKSDLDLHYKCHETNQPFFLCYVCFKPFRWKKDMIRHVRKKHPAERTYRCLYCSERFSKNDELTIHIAKSHPEHRSFLCTICGRRYAQRRYLLVHYQTQHNIDPEGQQHEVQEGNSSGSGNSNNVMMENYYDHEEAEPTDMDIDIGSFLQTEHRM